MQGMSYGRCAAMVGDKSCLPDRSSSPARVHNSCITRLDLQPSDVALQGSFTIYLGANRGRLVVWWHRTFRPRWLSDDWWVYEGRSWCGQPWFAALLVNWATFLALDSTGGVGPLVDEWPFLR